MELACSFHRSSVFSPPKAQLSPYFEQIFSVLDALVKKILFLCKMINKVNSFEKKAGRESLRSQPRHVPTLVHHTEEEFCA